MKGHGKTRCGLDEPAKAARDIPCVAAERAELELQADCVELFDFSTNLLDVPVAEPAQPGVLRAQQILVEIEDGDVEEVGQMVFESLSIRSNATELVACGNNRQPLALSGQFRDGANRTDGGRLTLSHPSRK